MSSLGRDDIAVGDVSQEDGRLRFPLTRAGYEHSDEIPIEVLADRDPRGGGTHGDPSQDQ